MGEPCNFVECAAFASAQMRLTHTRRYIVNFHALTVITALRNSFAGHENAQLIKLSACVCF